MRPMPVMRATAFALLLLGATIALVSFNNAAFADKVPLNDISQSSLSKTCQGAGGTFRTSEDGGYSCETGKGSVTCTDKRKCTGECETCGVATAKSGKGSPLGVLSGSTLKKSGSASAKPTAEPVKNAGPKGIKKPGEDLDKGGTSKSGMGNSEDHHGKK